MNGIPNEELSPGFIKPDWEGIVPKQLIGDRGDSDLVKQLTGMNDGDGGNGISVHTFPEIADWIEENVEFV